MTYISENSKKLKVSGKYDVVVVGGGIAGISAAVAAARNGAKTLLIEKQFALGGLATLGLVTIYLPLCDGNGRQVTFGLAEELMLLTTKDGSAKIPASWDKQCDNSKKQMSRYQLEFNPASTILAFEQFVLDNNVDLLYDTRFSTVIKTKDTIQAVIVENKSGRSAIECGWVVDATGDADVCHAANETTITLSTNTASGWYYNQGSDGNKLFNLYTPFDPEGKIVPEGSKKGFDGTDAQSVTEMMIRSRDLIREHIKSLRKKTPKDTWPFLIPTLPGLRMTRRLKGEFDFPAHDMELYNDSIGLICNWYKKGPVYSIPFRSLCAVKTNNLLAAGRCISAIGHGWDQSRVIPACAVTGQAAGTAAATSPNVSKIKIKKLQDNLRNQKCRLILSEL